MNLSGPCLAFGQAVTALLSFILRRHLTSHICPVRFPSLAQVAEGGAREEAAVDFMVLNIASKSAAYLGQYVMLVSIFPPAWSIHRVGSLQLTVPSLVAIVALERFIVKMHKHRWSAVRTVAP